MGKQTLSLSQWEKLLSLPVWRLKQFGRWLTRGFLNATKHLPDKEELIFKVFKSSVLLLVMIKKSLKFKSKIISMLGSLPESKWTTFLDSLNSSSDPSMLTMQLFKILGQELISRDKGCQPFWNPAFKELSEKLLLPIGTDFVGLASNSSSNWLTKQVEKSKLLMIKSTSPQSKSSQKTSWPSSMYSLASKWDEEAMPIANLKTLIVKIYPTTRQRTMLNKYIDTSRYVYNKTLELVKNKGHKPNFQSLRDILVTENSKKGYTEYQVYDKEIKDLQKQKKETEDDALIKELGERIKQLNTERRDKMKDFGYVKNDRVLNFELETPKDIRACAVKRCCDAYKTGFTNVKRGNIRHFNMAFKKKKEQNQTLEVTQKLFSITKDGNFKLTPDFLKEEAILKVHAKSRKKLKNLKIQNNIDIVRNNQGYFVHVLVPTSKRACQVHENIGSIDLGIRTLGTVHIHNVSSNETSIIEYKHRDDLLKKYNNKLDILKSRQGREKKKRKRKRKRHFLKLEKKKKDVVDLTHWLFINDLLSRTDIIYLGDIKSHDIVRGGKNKRLNRAFNDLKFYQLKTRLLYKAGLLGKLVDLTPEPYTTKTCSRCGAINNNVGSKEVFACPCCNLVTGRDFNAAKNMKMKGILS